MKTLAMSIIDNRIRHARYKKYESILRKIRLKVFDYEDMGPEMDAKAQRVLHKCKKILEPAWQARHDALEHARQQRLLYTWA